MNIACIPIFRMDFSYMNMPCITITYMNISCIINFYMKIFSVKNFLPYEHYILHRFLLL